MEQQPKPKLAIQPSAEQRNETLETLTEGKVIDESSQPQQQLPAEAETELQPFDRGNAEPGGGVIKEVLRPHDPGVLGDDANNQSDGRADILPR